MHEVLLLMKTLQSKPQVENKNIKFLICILLSLKIYQMWEEKNEVSDKSFQAFSPLNNEAIEPKSKG